MLKPVVILADSAYPDTMLHHSISYISFILYLGLHIWAVTCIEGGYKCMVQGHGKL